MEQSGGVVNYLLTIWHDLYSKNCKFGFSLVMDGN